MTFQDTLAIVRTVKMRAISADMKINWRGKDRMEDSLSNLLPKSIEIKN